MKLSQLDPERLGTALFGLTPAMRQAALEKLLDEAWLRGWEDCAESAVDKLADQYTADEILTIAAQSGIEVRHA